MSMDNNSEEKAVVPSYSTSQVQSIIKYDLKLLRLSEDAQEYLTACILNYKGRPVDQLIVCINQGVNKRHYSHSDVSVIRRKLNI